MKVTDLKVTMVNWNSGPWATATASFGGSRQLGVVTVSTDEGVDGYAFLGSSRQGADAYVGPLMEFIKPALLGRDPLDIGAIWAWMWKNNRNVSTNAIGAVDVALWDIAGKVAGAAHSPSPRFVPRQGARLRQFRLPGHRRGIRRRSPGTSWIWAGPLTRFIPMPFPEKTSRFAVRRVTRWAAGWT